MQLTCKEATNYRNYFRITSYRTIPPTHLRIIRYRTTSYGTHLGTISYWTYFITNCMGEETATKTSGGLPNLSLMKTPVYRLHSLVKLLRPSLHLPTAALTQTRSNIDQSAWMPDVPLEITTEELHQVIKKCKASLTASPINQMHYCIFKNCPHLMPALLHLSTPVGPLHRWHHSGRLDSYTFSSSKLVSWIPGCPATSDPLP